jgi:hypothetical protein
MDKQKRDSEARPERGKAMSLSDLELFQEVIDRINLKYGSVVITAKAGKWLQTSIGSCSAPHIVAFRGREGLERYKNVRLS